MKKEEEGRGYPHGGVLGCPFGRRVDCMHVQAAGCELSLQLAMHIGTPRGTVE